MSVEQKNTDFEKKLPKDIWKALNSIGKKTLEWAKNATENIQEKIPILGAFCERHPIAMKMFCEGNLLNIEDTSKIKSKTLEK